MKDFDIFLYNRSYKIKYKKKITHCFDVEHTHVHVLLTKIRQCTTYVTENKSIV